MKTRFIVILSIALVIVSGAVGWFAKGYHVEQARADFLTTVIPEVETTVTLEPVRIDTVRDESLITELNNRVKSLTNLLRKKPKVVTIRDTVEVIAEAKIPVVKTTFEYSPPEMYLKIYGYAPCPIDSMTTVHKLKQDYINNIIRNAHTVKEYPWYGKAFWVGTGILVGYMGNEWYRTLKHNRTL